MELSVLGQWSSKVQRLPGLGFHCRNRIGVEGGPAGKLVGREGLYTGNAVRDPQISYEALGLLTMVSE